MKAREVTRRYVGACAKLPAMETLARQLGSQQPCSRAEGHSRVCPRIEYFSPAVVRNWRVLWYSLPSGARRERLLEVFRDSLEQHRQQGGYVEQ